MIYGFAPLSQTLPYWPVDIFGKPEFLDEIGIQDYTFEIGDDLLAVEGTLLWFREISLGIPGLNGFSIALLSGGDLTAIPFHLRILPSFSLTLPNLSVSFRLSSELLRPVRLKDGKWVEDRDNLGQLKPAELRFDGIGVRADLDGDLELLMPAGAPVGHLTPVQIGETGFVVEVDGLTPYFSRKQPPLAGVPEGFRGLKLDSVKLHLPDAITLDEPLIPSDITLSDSFIGTGGFSGVFTGGWGPPRFEKTSRSYIGKGAGKLFGIPFGLQSITLTFKQNVPVESSLIGQILLPFFDEPVDVEIGISLDGGLFVRLTSESGLKKLVKENILSIEIDSIGFEVKNDVFTTKLSGKVTPLFKSGDIDWPAFQVKELSIDSNGNVHLDGGWIDLPKQYSLDFYGFKLEITKVGLGKTEDGGKWIGFSGGLKLVEGLKGNASVEGLRIIWYDDGRTPPVRISFEGVQVEFKKPKVIEFKGAVAYREFIEDGKTKHRFDGAITLKLPKLKLEVDATLVIGSASGPNGNYTFFAVYVAAELPKGIPIFSTGLALYGMAGLFALNMEPKKEDNEEWYEGWYKRSPVGLTDLKGKWIDREGSLALGAGVTIGTLNDNGYNFSGKVILVLLFPGPVLLIEGKANLLKERAKLSDDPTFRALAVLDERAGTFLLGLDAHYTKDESGALIDIRGSAEAFFNFNDASAWHIYLGKDEPREKRIRARAFKRLYQPAAYFMLDAQSLRTGIWLGYDKTWKFSSLSVSLEAWIESNVKVSWKPTQFDGSLWLHGKAQLKAFGRGVGLNIDAKLIAEVFKPFILEGEFSVRLSLPWPLPSPKANITLKWPPDKTPPPLPLPVKEIAVEHFKATTSWPLSRGTLLLPDYDNDRDGFVDDFDKPTGQSEPPNLKGLPVVPLDCRPHITFGRSMNDDALVGVNAQPRDGEWEIIGDPSKGGIARVRYGLKGLALHKWQPMAPLTSPWHLVARKGTTDDSGPAAELYGSWAHTPEMPDGGGEHVGQTKLWLWSKTPFDYTRHTGRNWDEWFTDRFKHYPCVVMPPDRQVCWNFENVTPAQRLQPPVHTASQPAITILWHPPGERFIEVLKEPIQGLTHALCFPRGTAAGPNVKRIVLSEPASSVSILVAAEKTCIDFTTRDVESIPGPRVENGAVFTSKNTDGNADEFSSIRESVNGGTGLYCGNELVIDLPCPSSSVELSLSRALPIVGFSIEDQTRQASPNRIRIEPFGIDGSSISLQRVDQERSQKVMITGDDISRIIIRAADGTTLLDKICFQCSARPGTSLFGKDANNNSFIGRFLNDNLIEVRGDNITEVTLLSSEEICILEICANFGPGLRETSRRELMAQHLEDEMVRWSHTGEVLEPNTTYRLTVETTIEAQGVGVLQSIKKSHTVKEFAYFRTEGPPGLANLSIPDGAETNVGVSGLKELVLRNKGGEIITVDESDNVGEADELDRIPDGSRPVLKSDLNDLTRYVHQTMPATVTETGDLLLPRPVYRAYDIGVEFNEDYVEQLYRTGGRDLGLYLYDNNNQPVRDAQGRLIVLNNIWSTSRERILDESEVRWLTLIRERPCASIDPSEIPFNNALASQAEGQVLNPDTIYEARLSPMLLHEDFADGLRRWSVVGGSADWRIEGHGTLRGSGATVTGQVVALDGSPDLSNLDVNSDVIFLNEDTAQLHGRYRILSYNNLSNPKTVTVDATPSLKRVSSPWRIPAQGAVVQSSPARTMLLAGDLSWTDYRFSVFMRSTSSGLLGVVFRARPESGRHYLFTINPTQNRRQLLKAGPGGLQQLANDNFVFSSGREYLVTVEAVGSSLRVYQDGALVFSATDSEITSGRVGLYSDGNTQVHFRDVRVDDFRAEAPVVYQFKFTTSLYANFFHHLHSFQDETWPATSPLLTLAPFLKQDYPSEEEALAYEDLWIQVFGNVASHNPKQVQVTRIKVNGQSPAFLFQSPEPIDWKRCELKLKRADREAPRPEPPGAVKLTDVTLATNHPREESITLLLRENTNLTGYNIEYRPFATSPEAQLWAVYYTFGSESLLEAGTRVCLHATNELDVPAKEPGIAHRFIAPIGGAGQRRLPSEGVDLRLVLPDGSPGHSRRFFPDSNYLGMTENIVLARKADGTAFFLLMLEAGSSNSRSLPVGQYRIEMSYRRDNKASYSNSQILSQAGSTSAEQVKLDIPWQTR